MPEIRDSDRRGLKTVARDADEYRRMCEAYRMGWHAAKLAAIDAVGGVKAQELPAYEEPENAD